MGDKTVLTKEEKRNRWKTHLLFLFVFSLFSAFFLYLYRSQGRSFVHFGGDGYRQHYKALLYYSDFLKQVIYNLFHEGRFITPQWDFSIGEGSDVLQTLHYYCIGDPINLPCVFFDETNMYLFYEFSVLFRLYLAGEFFILLCHETGKSDPLAIVSGALVFLFSEYGVMTVSGHPFFITPMVYLPLILCGVERIIRKDRYPLFVFAVMFASLSNIYFFYMAVILTVVYTLIRLIFLKEDLKKKLILLLKIGVCSVFGLMMSAVVFLPMCSALLNNSRLFANNQISLFYDSWYYLSLIPSFVMGQNGHFGTYTIIGVFAILSAVRRKRWFLLSLFGVGMLFEMIPFFSSLMNGMSYTTGRWLFALALTVAYLVTDRFEDLTNRDNLYLILFTLVYYPLCILLDRSEYRAYILFIAVTAIFLAGVRFLNSVKVKKLITFAVVSFFVLFISVYKYSPMWWNRASTGTKIDVLLNIKENELSALRTIDDDSFWRFSGNSLEVNTTVLSGHSAPQFYWSVANSDIAVYRKEMAFLDNSSYHYENDTDRFIPLSLDGVKYYIADHGYESVPYSYTYLKTVGDYDIYENKNYVPLVSVYDSYMRYEDWKQFDPIRKQEVLTKAVVLEEDVDLNRVKEIASRSVDVECGTDLDEGLKIEDGKVLVTVPASTARLSFRGEEAGEYYLMIEGLRSPNSSKWKVTYKDATFVINYKSPTHETYSGRHDFAVNLGYHEGIDDSLEIRFPDAGEFTYENIRIVCLPLEEQITDLEKRKDIDVKKLTVGDNDIDCDLSLKEDKILFLSVPYAKGWKATLDGSEVNLMRADCAYMAVLAGKGDHTLSLTYRTPLLKEGALISVLGLCAYVIFERFHKNRKD